MGQYRIAITYDQALVVMEALEYEIESINNALYDGRIADTESIKRRDNLRDFRGTLDASINANQLERIE